MNPNLNSFLPPNLPPQLQEQAKQLWEQLNNLAKTNPKAYDTFVNKQYEEATKQGLNKMIPDGMFAPLPVFSLRTCVVESKGKEELNKNKREIREVVEEKERYLKDMVYIDVLLFFIIFYFLFLFYLFVVTIINN